MKAQSAIALMRIRGLPRAVRGSVHRSALAHRPWFAILKPQVCLVAPRSPYAAFDLAACNGARVSSGRHQLPL